MDCQTPLSSPPLAATIDGAGFSFSFPHFQRTILPPTRRRTPRGPSPALRPLPRSHGGPLPPAHVCPPHSILGQPWVGWLMASTAQAAASFAVDPAPGPAVGAEGRGWYWGGVTGEGIMCSETRR